MKIWWAFIRRFFYLLVASFRGEFGLTGLVNGRVEYVAAGVVREKEIVPTRVFYDASKKPGV